MNDRTRGGITTTLLTLLLVAGFIGVVAWFFNCPCERTPGGYLLGDEIETPVSDWTFANDVPLCQIQVRAGFLPHSINLNCMASSGQLFLSCSGCDGKYWSTAVLSNPAARLRLGDEVYPVVVTRVQDPATLDRAWIARAAKLDRPADTPRRKGWWSFRVVSR
ncbi:MAG: hypothetical protein ACC642_04195 [Pseudomonadales bacterium]